MAPIAKPVQKKLLNFIGGSPAGLLQVLVAAARPSTFNRILDCPTYPVPTRTKGLSEIVSLFREAISSQKIDVPTFLGSLFISTRAVEDRKLVGQFFTSREVAEWTLSVATPLAKEDICDAGAGAGVFADAIIRSGIPIGSYTGIENDPTLALCAAHVLDGIGAPDTYKIWYANFLLLTKSGFNRHNLRIPTFVIANPPFVRARKLTGRDRIRAAIQKGYGLAISSLAGSSSYFLARAAELVDLDKSNSKRGASCSRLLFLLPKEADGAGHAQRIRSDLQRIHGWSWTQYEIPILNTGIDRHPSNAAGLCFLFEQKSKDQKITGEFRLVPAIPLKNLLNIRRGISTGRNEFFVLTDENTKDRELPIRYLRPVLPTRISISEKDISMGYWDQLRASGHPCWLLALPYGKIDDFEVPVREYLREGLRNGIHLTPTAKSLKSWFSIPLPSTAPDVFITYLFRGSPRFILNSAKVFHLTNILGGRFESPVPNLKVQTKIVDILTEQASRWMSANAPGREYKGGLRKIEPREFSLLELDPTTIGHLEQIGRTVLLQNQSLFD